MEPGRAMTGTNKITTTTMIVGAALTGLLRALVTHNHDIVEGRYNVGNGAGTSGDGVAGLSGTSWAGQSLALIAGACSVVNDTSNDIG